METGRRKAITDLPGDPDFTDKSNNRSGYLVVRKRSGAWQFRYADFLEVVYGYRRIAMSSGFFRPSQWERDKRVRAFLNAEF